jgi:hypothetical protein
MIYYNKINYILILNSNGCISTINCNEMYIYMHLSQARPIFSGKGTSSNIRIYAGRLRIMYGNKTYSLLPFKYMDILF